MPKALLVPLAFVCALFGSASVALAAPASKALSVAVVELDTPPNMMGLGAQTTRQVQRHAERAGFRVVPPTTVQESLGAEGYDALRKCGPDVACALARARGLPAQRLVWGSLDRDARSYLLKLWLIELPGGARIAEVDRSILIASRRLVAVVDEVVPKLLRGEREADGTLVLTSSVPGARVRIDGRESGETPLTVALSPGQHEVRLEKEDFLPVQRLITVESGKTTQENIRILAVPGADPLALPAAQRARMDEQRRRQADRGWLGAPTGSWLSFGVAALAAGGGVALGVSSKGIEDELREGFDEETGRYTGTRDLALEGKRRALFANVLYGVAGAAAAFGGVWWWLSGDESSAAEGKTSVTVTPTAGSGGGGGTLSIEGRF